jgi:hypothetical protein
MGEARALNDAAALLDLRPSAKVAWQTAGILILRHQLAVLQRRQPRRPNLNWADRHSWPPCPDVIPKGRYQEPRLLVNTRHDPALAPPGRHSAGCLARSGGSAGTSVAVCGGSLPGRCGCQPACPLPGRSRSPRRHAAAPPAAAPPRVPPPVPSRHPTAATPAHRTSSLLRLGHQARTIAPGGRLVSTAYSRNVCLPGLSYYWARRGNCWSRRPDRPGPGAARAAGPCSGPG